MPFGLQRILTEPRPAATGQSDCAHSSHHSRENLDLGPLREQVHGRATFAALVAEAGRLQSEAQAMAKPEVPVFSPDRVDESSPLLLALHMRLANAEDAAVQWRAAVSAGLVLAVPQSSQVAGVNAFYWDDIPRAAQGLAAVYTQLRETRTFDPDRVIVAGASQGGGLAITLALNGGVLPSRRFIAVVPLIQDAQDTTALRQADIATLAQPIHGSAGGIAGNQSYRKEQRSVAVLCCTVRPTAEAGSMTNEEILRWALLTACPEHWQVILDGRISTNPWHYIPLIYSHHFAKAFRGEDWEYHHWQLICHSDDPLSYLARFL